IKARQRIEPYAAHALRGGRTATQDRGIGDRQVPAPADEDCRGGLAMGGHAERTMSSAHDCMKAWDWRAPVAMILDNPPRTVELQYAWPAEIHCRGSHLGHGARDRHGQSA